MQTSTGAVGVDEWTYRRQFIALLYILIHYMLTLMELAIDGVDLSPGVAGHVKRSDIALLRWIIRFLMRWIGNECME